MKESYNNFERSIARILSKTPIFKKAVKVIYSRIVYIKNRKKYKFKTKYMIRPVAGMEGEESFFGYYDKSPTTMSGMTLVNMVDHPTSSLPSTERCITVSVYKNDEVEDPVFSVSTNVYNWQQGARAQWLTDDLFVMNDVDINAGCYISRVYSIEKGGLVKVFSLPVQDAYGTDYFLSINYRRLMLLRPDYGYRNLPAMKNSELKCESDDGIFKTDFDTGKNKLLYSIERIKGVCSEKKYISGFHKLNHIMISPGGGKFIFLHRCYLGNRRFDRLILADATGSTIKPLTSFGMVSHCFWLDDNTILSYLRGPNGKDAYWLIDCVSGKFKPFANGVLDAYGDGHPHVCGAWVVTDTYPDKSRMQKLLLCNWKTGEKRELGEFYHGFNYSGESRCDLHPRFSKDGSKIFFDSVFSGKRQMYCLELFDKV